MVTKWAYLSLAAALVAICRHADASASPICYPSGTINFLQGLGVRDLPPGVTESCDVNDVIAYEVDESSSIAAHFRRVIDKGYYKKQLDDQIYGNEWPGDFSVSMRVRIWEAADIVNIYASNGGHKFGIGIGGSDGINIKINGLGPVQISTINVVDGQFHRIILSLLGTKARVKVSGPDAADCGAEEVTELRFGTSDRKIPVARSIVVLGREGDSAIETPQMTIQQLVFMPDPESAYTCPYEIICSSEQPAQLPESIDRNKTEGETIHKKANGDSPDEHDRDWLSNSTNQSSSPDVKTEIRTNETCEGLNYTSSDESLMRNFLHRQFQLPPGIDLTPKQFSFNRRRKVVRAWFKDADRDKNKELSATELLDFAISLSERNYVSEKCSLWLMQRCLQNRKRKMDLKALRGCFGVATRQLSKSDP
jgi:hypothetical protein